MLIEFNEVGFIWALLVAPLQSGFSELEISDLTGHKKSNVGRLEAGRTYFGRQEVSKLVKMIMRVSKI